MIIVLMEKGQKMAKYIVTEEQAQFIAKHIGIFTGKELVECKDCKWFGKIESFSYCYKLCINKTIGFSEDGYCSWGERREDG